MYTLALFELRNKRPDLFPRKGYLFSSKCFLAAIDEAQVVADKMSGFETRPDSGSVIDQFIVAAVIYAQTLLDVAVNG